jgi:hypothetical protein
MIGASTRRSKRWTLMAGLDGAQRIIDQMPATSVFAPDAEIVRASIAA